MPLCGSICADPFTETTLNGVVRLVHICRSGRSVDDHHDAYHDERDDDLTDPEVAHAATNYPDARTIRRGVHLPRQPLEPDADCPARIVLPVSGSCSVLPSDCRAWYRDVEAPVGAQRAESDDEYPRRYGHVQILNRASTVLNRAPYLPLCARLTCRDRANLCV